MTDEKYTNDYVPTYIWGWGLETVGESGKTLDCWFPKLASGEIDEKNDAFSEAMENGAPAELARLETYNGQRRITKTAIFFLARVQDEINGTCDAFLRLHALSMRIVKPNTINLDGLFDNLTNVVWTNFGPCEVDSFEQVRIDIASKTGQFPTVYSVDKIPRMVDYVVPTGVRIANADTVRLGAYLAEGTTVMHAGFVNFNAGTLGVSMVEGRISQGVTVDDGSDIGGGASIMGTLSGGGKVKVRIGKHSLLGANAGLGIQLGDDCIVEAGLYVTAGTKIKMDGRIMKARELSGAPNLLFRRNSQTGSIEVTRRPVTQHGIELNSTLHKN